MSGVTPIVETRGLCHWYGEGELRRQVLFGVDLQVLPGEILILTGPSGSGKTTLLTLLGALRSPLEGSLRFLGRELRDADPRERVAVRRRIGYVFQAHNLLDALDAAANVGMAVALGGHRGPEVRRRAVALLEAVGLADHVHKPPRQLSGGQRQRVAIARALAVEPKLLLADEPTAALDRRTGREVVSLIENLARRERSAVVIVTHDSRILDVADRIVHLEDGRLQSLTMAAAGNTRHFLEALARTAHQGELRQRLRELALPEFAALLEEVTDEFQQLLEVIGLSRDAAFEGMLEEVLEAFTARIGSLLEADRSSLFMVDRERGEMWSKVTTGAGEIRVPIAEGIAGRVARTGEAMNVPDAYAEPLFNRRVDSATGYRTRSLLCLPIRNEAGEVFAVMQLLNKSQGRAFDAEDERVFGVFAERVGVMLETWSAMHRDVGRAGRSEPGEPREGGAS